MTGRKNAWTVSNFSKALYGTTGGTYSACIIRPVMNLQQRFTVMLSYWSLRKNGDGQRETLASKIVLTHL